MIRVGEVILTEEGWALGQSVSDDEFWKRYGAAPGGMRGSVLAQGHPGRSEGRVRGDGADSEETRAGRGGCTSAPDAGGVGEAEDWIGDSCRAIDRRVYG